MKNALILAAVIVTAVMSLAALVFDDNVTKLQNRIARRRGIEAPDALEAAQRRRAASKTAFVLVPAIIAVGLNVWALFVS